MRRFDVVIVGAGVIGLAVALQVRRALGASTLVIDREDSPGMGSTSRANGGVRAQFTTPVNIAFSRYTIEALRELDATSSGLVGYRPVGYLFLAGTEASEAWLRSAYLTQRGHSVDVRWLTPGDVAALTPFIETRGLRAATFCASDGIIDPHGVVSALAGQCRRLGVEFELSCEVSAVDASGAPVRLQTARGGLGATWVVNAAGPNARVVAALAGIDLPVLAYRRNLVCTERVTEPPPLVPMCVD